MTRDLAPRRIIVLDTNVLMHDPVALYRFGAADIYLPIIVLEELDRAKKGVSELARNVRQVSRFLDDLISHVDAGAIEGGIALSSNGHGATGKLFFQIRPPSSAPNANGLGRTPDNDILQAALALKDAHALATVSIVSKDINLRVKAKVLGIGAEDYYDDQVLDDVSLLYSGVRELSQEFWSRHGQSIESWQEQDRTYYRLGGADLPQWYPRQCMYIPGENGFEALVTECTTQSATLVVAKDYRGTSHRIWGINARNLEQNFALNLLLDPEIDFVTLLGTAGTGKTLLTLAAGLAQTLEDKRYREIVMTRATVPVGEDIGFLPGTEEEKMTPWMGALMDNLEVLSGSNSADEWGRAAAQDLLHNRIKIRSLNFMRGRTFQGRYIIVDEAQNLTPKQMKTLITRAGPGTKVICLGNIAQIDTPYLSETTSGLTYVVDHFKGWSHSGHITLRRGERSRLADYAADNL